MKQANRWVLVVLSLLALAILHHTDTPLEEARNAVVATPNPSVILTK